MTNWKEIHPDFTPHLQSLWERWEWDYPSYKPQFTSQEVQAWINKGLTPLDYDFVRYLKREKYNFDQELDLENLRQEHQNNLVWTDINFDFAEKIPHSWSKTKQQEWKERSFTYQEAKQWIKAGFHPRDYQKVKTWKDYNFTPQETEELIDLGFFPQEAEFAFYLKQNNYQFTQINNLAQLRQNYCQTQPWLNYWYPREGNCIRKGSGNYTRKQLTQLHVENQDLEGELDLNEFTNLWSLTLVQNHKINSIKLGSCLNLRGLYLGSMDGVKNLELNPQILLEFIHLGGCQIERLDLSSYASSLSIVELISLPKLISLEGLDKLIKLNALDIQGCGMPFRRPIPFLNSQLIKVKTSQNLHQLNHLISPTSTYNFQSLQSEIKRLKIQDLNIQIPLKKQELEQSTNNLKNNLGLAGKYLLDKLLKKQNKLLLNNETNSEKLEEIKQALNEINPNQESLQNLLNQQKELFSLENHLENLQSEEYEQVAQIVQTDLPRNN